jgi:hypothetical protein
MSSFLRDNILHTLQDGFSFPQHNRVCFHFHSCFQHTLLAFSAPRSTTFLRFCVDQLLASCSTYGYPRTRCWKGSFSSFMTPSFAFRLSQVKDIAWATQSFVVLPTFSIQRRCLCDAIGCDSIHAYRFKTLHQRRNRLWSIHIYRFKDAVPTAQSVVIRFTHTDSRRCIGGAIVCGLSSSIDSKTLFLQRNRL